MASQVSVSGTPGDASPGPATASVATTGPASIKDFSCPVVPRESSESLAKLPCCRAPRFAPVAPHGARGESVPDAGASPRRLQNALASRKRHLGVGNHQLWLPRQRRISAGCLVSQSVGAPSDHAAIQRQRSAFSVPLAPKRHHRRVLSSPLSACAPGRFSPPSLPDFRARQWRVFRPHAGHGCLRSGSDGGARHIASSFPRFVSLVGLPFTRSRRPPVPWLAPTVPGASHAAGHAVPARLSPRRST